MRKIFFKVSKKKMQDISRHKIILFMRKFCRLSLLFILKRFSCELKENKRIRQGEDESPIPVVVPLHRRLVIRRPRVVDAQRLRVTVSLRAVVIQYRSAHRTESKGPLVQMRNSWHFSRAHNIQGRLDESTRRETRTNEN